MKKFAFTAMSALMLAGGLAACNTNDDSAFNDRYDNNTRPIGYYTDDNDNTRRGWVGNRDDNNANRNNGQGGWFGNRNVTNNNDGRTMNNGRNGTGFNNNNDGRGITNDRNDGPLTDMMDGDDQNRFGDNPQNSNRRGANENRTNIGYYDGTDGQLARQVSDRVKGLKGVKDARTIVYGDEIVVGVNSKNNNEKQVDKQVRNAVRDIVQTRNITVVSNDKDMFNRIRSVDDGLRDGNGMREVQSDINAIFTDLGDAIKRPFQNNR